MKAMKQLSLAETGFLPKAGKQTRKAVFLAEMETVVPWSRLETLIEPFYPKKGNGRPPMPLVTLTRPWKKRCTTFPCCASSQDSMLLKM